MIIPLFVFFLVLIIQVIILRQYLYNPSLSRDFLSLYRLSSATPKFQFRNSNHHQQREAKFCQINAISQSCNQHLKLICCPVCLAKRIFDSGTFIGADSSIFMSSVLHECVFMMLVCACMRLYFTPCSYKEFLGYLL